MQGQGRDAGGGTEQFDVTVDALLHEPGHQGQHTAVVPGPQQQPSRPLVVLRQVLVPCSRAHQVRRTLRGTALPLPGLHQQQLAPRRIGLERVTGRLDVVGEHARLDRRPESVGRVDDGGVQTTHPPRPTAGAQRRRDGRAPQDQLPPLLLQDTVGDEPVEGAAGVPGGPARRRGQQRHVPGPDPGGPVDEENEVFGDTTRLADGRHRQGVARQHRRHPRRAQTHPAAHRDQAVGTAELVDGGEHGGGVARERAERAAERGQQRRVRPGAQ